MFWQQDAFCIVICNILNSWDQQQLNTYQFAENPLNVFFFDKVMIFHSCLPFYIKSSKGESIVVLVKNCQWYLNLIM